VLPQKYNSARYVPLNVTDAESIDKAFEIVSRDIEDTGDGLVGWYSLQLHKFQHGHGISCSLCTLLQLQLRHDAGLKSADCSTNQLSTVPLFYCSTNQLPNWTIVPLFCRPTISLRLILSHKSTNPLCKCAGLIECAGAGYTGAAEYFPMEW
jgi:hypothetical protein